MDPINPLDRDALMAKFGALLDARSGYAKREAWRQRQIQKFPLWHVAGDDFYADQGADSFGLRGMSDKPSRIPGYYQDGRGVGATDEGMRLWARPFGDETLPYNVSPEGFFTAYAEQPGTDLFREFQRNGGFTKEMVGDLLNQGGGVASPYGDFLDPSAPTPHQGIDPNDIGRGYQVSPGSDEFLFHGPPASYQDIDAALRADIDAVLMDGEGRPNWNHPENGGGTGVAEPPKTNPKAGGKWNKSPIGQSSRDWVKYHDTLYDPKEGFPYGFPGKHPEEIGYGYRVPPGLEPPEPFIHPEAAEGLTPFKRLFPNGILTGLETDPGLPRLDERGQGFHRGMKADIMGAFRAPNQVDALTRSFVYPHMLDEADMPWNRGIPEEFPSPPEGPSHDFRTMGEKGIPQDRWNTVSDKRVVKNYFYPDATPQGDTNFSLARYGIRRGSPGMRPYVQGPPMERYMQLMGGPNRLMPASMMEVADAAGLTSAGGLAGLFGTTIAHTLGEMYAPEATRAFDTNFGQAMDMGDNLLFGPMAQPMRDARSWVGRKAADAWGWAEPKVYEAANHLGPGGWR